MIRGPLMAKFQRQHFRRKKADCLKRQLKWWLIGVDHLWLSEPEYAEAMVLKMSKMVQK